MGWVWISKIKNQTGEWNFPVPGVTITNSDLTGTGISQKNIGGYREYNSAQMSARYAEAQALGLDLIAQLNSDITIYSGVRDGNCSKFIYGKMGGTGLQVSITRSNPNQNIYAFSDYYLRRYQSFTNYTTYNPAATVTVGHSGKYDNPFYTFGFIMNSDEEKIYLVVISGNRSWYGAVGIPAYYDSCYFNLMIFDESRANYWNTFLGSIPSGGGDTPYGDDDYTEPIGGDGDHDEISEEVETSPIPVAAATRCGMITAFVPTWGEIQSVADALLDPNIFQILASTIVKPSDVIIGLSVFPCTIPANSSATVTASFLGLRISTGVIAHVADNQYVEINCGDLDINEYWGNCLDYNPYTNISIFLPFCGMYELDADEVMGRTLNVSYRIDIFSGACLATIKIDGSVFYQYTGQCSSQIPINSVSFDNFLSSMLDIGIATATGVAAVKGAGAAVDAASKAFSEAKSSEVKGAFEDYLDAKANYTKVKEHSGESLLGASVNGVMGGKGFYSHAGAVGGSPGFLAVKKPFVIIKRPEQVIPSMYGKFHGYPANTTANLSDLTGYTEVSDIRLNIPDATVDEIIECEQLLKGGVVL